MLTKLFSHIAKVLLIPFIAVLHSAGYQLPQITDSSIHAGTVPQYVAAAPTTLYGSGINSSQTSIKLSSLTLPDGVTPITTNQLVGGLSGIGSVFYATIEPGAPTKETVSCTAVVQNADGTASITGCTRGLLFTTPYTASTSFARAHSGGSAVVISNSPQLYNDIIQYVASSSASGAADASTIAKGIVQLATGLQAASTSPIGSGGTSAALALSTSISTSTSPGSGNWIPVTVNGSLSGTFLKNTSGAILGSTTFTGTTTLPATSTSIGGFPIYQILAFATSSNATTTVSFATSSNLRIEITSIGGGDQFYSLTFNGDNTSHYGYINFSNYVSQTTNASSSGDTRIRFQCGNSGSSPVGFFDIAMSNQSLFSQKEGTINGTCTLGGGNTIFSSNNIWTWSTTTQATSLTLAANSSSLATTSITVYGTPNQ